MDEPSRRAHAALGLATALSERLRWREAAEVARGALADLGQAERELALTLQAILADCVRMDLARARRARGATAVGGHSVG